MASVHVEYKPNPDVAGLGVSVVYFSYSVAVCNWISPFAIHNSKIDPVRSITISPLTSPQVILSFVISAILTLALSVTSIALRHSLVQHEAARFVKTIKSRRNPHLTFWENQFPILSDQHPLWPSIEDKRTRRSFWHRIIDKS